ncbi:putative peptidoglycan lipid II flippase [Breoghania corrubedonensis]|uniref:Probable lipid II flippase MurJ n=1 Tax=Breoghania corrubedonensis TaxID=665038 RepID=A0A2T5VHK1_9HYPH|nr:murein biosynthesis integral membrane protein MurJ [Breoghania corrubedonensis]PTW63235.1 putative peptidoglycan lipid II flippase [Breoghania corrubedonensis]
MSLLRNFATVGGATAASRVLGFVRDVLIAGFIGTGPVADAFFVAFRLPNLFRRLFAEGAFNSAFVPLFARSLEEDGRDGARRFAEEVLAALFWTLVALTAVAEIAMPGLVWVLAPGFAEDPAKFDLAVLLSRITFPYLLCMSLIALIGGVLNTFNRYTASALAPVLLNIVMIAVLSVIAVLGLDASRTSGIVLAAGVAFAGVVQLVSLVYALRRFGFSLKLRRPRYTFAVKRLWKLGLPGAVAGGITQINIAVGTIIASTQAGAVSYLYYADRIYQLPLGIVGIAIGVVLLPDLSRLLRSGNSRGALTTQNRALEFGLALTLPAAIALVAIPYPIVDVLFQRGAFTAQDAAATTAALAAYGLGLPAFVLIKVFSPAFFAREDTATPMWFAGIGMVVNVVGALLLAPFLAHVGIALATSLAGWINAGLLIVTLWRRGEFVPDRSLKKRLPLLILASVLMGGVVLAGYLLLASVFGHASLAIRGGALAALVLVGMVTFAVFVQVTGASDLLGYFRAALKKRGAKA